MNKQTTSIDWQSFQPEKSCLRNKTILVTGAADGIGKAVSIAAAKSCATVIMLDKKTRHLEKVYDHIVDKGYSMPVMLPLDLMNCTPETVQQISKGIEEDFGKLDILLHNAAELGSPSPLDQYDYEYWQKVMQTNLQAPYFLTKELLPLIKKSEQGQVLFTSAQAGRTPTAYWGAYGVAYAGLEAQMKIWSEELENPTNLSQSKSAMLTLKYLLE